MKYFTLFFYKVFEIQFVFHIYSASQFWPVTFQGLNSRFVIYPTNWSQLLCHNDHCYRLSPYHITVTVLISMVFLFHPQGSHMMQMPLSTHLLKWVTRDLKGFRALPKSTKLTSDRAGIQTQRLKKYIAIIFLFYVFR